MNRALTNADIEASALEVLGPTVSLPVNPTAVAEALGVGVHLKNLEDKVSGVLAVKGKQGHIFVNVQHHPNRQRFSIAHELGHYVLHDPDDRLFIDTNMRLYQRVGAPSSSAYSDSGSTTTPREEREANQFAACLLMPAFLIEQAASGRDLTDEFDVSALAARFGVSEQAMAIRLQQLGVVSPVFYAPQKSNSPTRGPRRTTERA